MIRSLLILAGIALALLAAEFGARVYHSYVKKHSAYQSHENSQIVFVRKPNFNPEVNSSGFRDRERTVRKSEEAFRIIVLGDSVTNGYRVDLEDRFTNKLESLLNGYSLQSGHHRRFEVINFGTNQYSTVQEVSLFETLAGEMQPDLIILAYVLNDPTPDGNLNRFFRRDRSPSLILAWLQRKLGDLFAYGEEFTRLEGCSFFDYYSRMHCDAIKWGNLLRSLSRLRELSRTNGFRVLVMVFPLFEDSRDASFDDYRWHEVHDRILSVAESLGFETLDLLPYFMQYRPSEIHVSGTDMLHPNALGNTIAADALFEKLRSMGVVGNPKGL